MPKLREELTRMIEHAKMLEVTAPTMYVELIERYKEMANGKTRGSPSTTWAFRPP